LRCGDVPEKNRTRNALLRELKELREKGSTLEACETQLDDIQAELKKHEDDVHALLNATPEIAFLMDKDGIVLAANESAARAYHTTVKELRGTCVYDRIPDPLARFARTKALETVDSETPVRFEMEWKGRFLDHSLYMVKDEKQRISSRPRRNIEKSTRMQPRVYSRQLSKGALSASTPPLRGFMALIARTSCFGR
jgi:PAS domain-containing protein